MAARQKSSEEIMEGESMTEKTMLNLMTKRALDMDILLQDIGLRAVQWQIARENHAKALDEYYDAPPLDDEEPKAAADAALDISMEAEKDLFAVVKAYRELVSGRTQE